MTYFILDDDDAQAARSGKGGLDLTPAWDLGRPVGRNTCVLGASGNPRGDTYGGAGFLGGQKEVDRLLE
jgi:hypothetical protein